MVALTAAALVPATASAATVRVETGGNDTTCAPNGGACRSIEHGVEIAAAGDIVEVGPGTFLVSSTARTGLLIDKRLDLRGNQYNVDARTRAVVEGESVITPAAPTATPYQGLFYVDRDAAGTSIRGFSLTGTRGDAGAGGAGIFTQPTRRRGLRDQREHHHRQRDRHVVPAPPETKARSPAT